MHPRVAEHSWPLVEKLWGQTRAVHRNFEFHVEEIFVRPGGYCSWHKHDAKNNHFAVSSGKLAVLTGSSQALRGIECWELNPGDTCRIENGRWHVFVALWGECRAIETYTRATAAIVAAGDIVRASEGGILPAIALAGGTEEFVAHLAGLIKNAA